MDFEQAFDSNNKFHVKWLKDLVNCKEGTLVHNPFGIKVDDTSIYLDVVMKLSKKFINESVTYFFGDLFSYEWAYQMEGEYQKCRLLNTIDGFKKGTFFEYVIVYNKYIEFYLFEDDCEPSIVLNRF